jgi:hypothetical protein
MRKPRRYSSAGDEFLSSHTQRGDQRFFYVSGKSEASSVAVDMRLQRMMGHFRRCYIPIRARCWWSDSGRELRPGSFVLYPEVQRIVVCELGA